jgi:hypothetical protein
MSPKLSPNALTGMLFIDLRGFGDVSISVRPCRFPEEMKKPVYFSNQRAGLCLSEAVVEGGLGKDRREPLLCLMARLFPVLYNRAP